MIRIVCDECDREDTVTSMSPGNYVTMPDGWAFRDQRVPPGEREEHLCPRCARRARERAR